MKEHIDRLGFEAWADNLIVDALEDFEALDAAELVAEGCTSDGEDASVVLRREGKHIHATVRAWVRGEGWKTTDRLITMKGGRP